MFWGEGRCFSRQVVIIFVVYYCLQRKEPVGDSEELPENVVNGLEELTPDILQVQPSRYMLHGACGMLHVHSREKLSGLAERVL